MQVAESTTDTQVCKTGRKCTVCDHPELSRIDSLLSDKSVSKRGIAVQFNLAAMNVLRHAKNHLAPRLTKALERRANKQADVFMERVEFLWDESTKGLERAKTAARTVTDPEGNLVYVGDDLRPLAPMLGACHKNLELLGNATGRFGTAIGGTTVNIGQAVFMPRADDAPAAKLEPVTIDVKCNES